ncbi:MAG: ABC transporter substrate-binding protein [Collinsella sp.]|nr:ABC transporter substrate-binding protein [Collinsella sp.]
MKHASTDYTVMSRRDVLAAGLAAMAGASALAGCGGHTDAGSAPAGSAPSHASATGVRVASLKGPTSIGLVSFMDRAKDADAFESDYTFTIATSADEILPSMIKGDLDISLIPANAASVLYNKTEGGVRCLDINTLGVLSVVTGDASLTDFEQLANRTVYLTGKGTTPEYAMNYLLAAAGIADTVTLEFKSEAAEVVSVLAADASAVGILPQPFVTAALVKNPALSAPIDLTDVWSTHSEDGSRMVTGVTVVRAAFADEHPEAVEEFLKAQNASVDAVNDDPSAAAPLVVEAGIVDAEPIAAKAIPGCHLVCITGDDMAAALSGYLQVLSDADPSSVGGALPDDDFYLDLDA